MCEFGHDKRTIEMNRVPTLTSQIQTKMICLKIFDVCEKHNWTIAQEISEHREFAALDSYI